MNRFGWLFLGILFVSIQNTFAQTLSEIQNGRKFALNEEGVIAHNIVNFNSTLTISFRCRVENPYKYAPGLIIADISNPAQPEELGRYYSEKEGMYGPDGQPVYSVARNEDTVYLAAETGLEIIDASDPANLERIGIFDPYDGYNWGGRIVSSGGTALYVPVSSMQILDIQNAREPKQLSTVNLPSEVFHIVWDGGPWVYLLVAQYTGFGEVMSYTEKHQLVIVDISNPEQPRTASTFPIESAWGINQIGDSLYASAAKVNSQSNPLKQHNIHRIDISDPQNPYITETISANYLPGPLIRADNYYIGTDLYWGGIRIFEIKNNFPIPVYTQSSATGFTDPVWDGRYVYTVQWFNTVLRVYDFLTPSNINVWNLY